MFQFRRFPSSTYEFSIRYMMINHVDCSIRKSADQSVLTTPRSLSQLTTSFIGSWCQGIHPALFLTLPILQMSFSVLFKTVVSRLEKSFSRISLVALLVVSYLHFSILFSSCSVLFQEQVWIINPSIDNSHPFLMWWAQVDSNHRPHAYQACALTTWAMRPFRFLYGRALLLNPHNVCVVVFLLLTFLFLQKEK